MSFQIARNLLRYIFWVRSGAIPFIFKTSFFSVLLNLIIILPVVLATYFLSDDHPDPDLSHLTPFATLLFAPLFENICFIGVIELLKCFTSNNRTIVLSIAVLSGLAHLIAGGARAIAGFIGFATMSYSYLIWNKASFPKRYAIGVLQHVLMNTPSTIFLLVIR